MRAQKISPLDPSVRIARAQAQQQQLAQQYSAQAQGGAELTIEQQIHQTHLATLAAQREAQQARQGLAQLQLSESKVCLVYSPVWV